MKIREVLTDESQWCQNDMAIDSQGEAVLSLSHQAARRCLAGWVLYCYRDPPSRFSIFSKITNSIPPHTAAEWNDDPSRTFAEVKALVEELDI